MLSARCFLILMLAAPSALAGGAGESSNIKWSAYPGGDSAELQSVKKVLLVAVPELTVESQFCEDVLTVELMAAEVKVVSRDKRDRELISRIESATEDQGTREGGSSLNENAEAKKGAKAQDPPAKLAEADLIAVGRATEADAVVTLQLVTETAQENIFSDDGTRATEVRSKLVAKGASLTVVDVQDGRLLLAGYVGYDNGVSILKAARDLGRGVAQKLK